MSKNVLYEAILEMEQEKYIKNLGDTLGFVTPRGLSEEEKKRYVAARNAVLASYFLVELVLNNIITHFTLYGIGLTITSENIATKFEELLDCWIDVAYKKKLRLVETIFKKDKIDFKILYKLDDLRDMFAHNFPLKNKRYNYKSKNIIQNRKVGHEFFEQLSAQYGELFKLQDSERGRLIGVVVAQSLINKQKKES